MFEDLINKLKAQVEELKKKLPGGNGDDDDDEYEDDEDDYEEKYHGDDAEEDIDDDGKTVQVQVKDLMEDAEDEEDSEESGSKEKTQKIVSDDDDEDDEDDEDEEDDDAAQKRKKLIMYGVVGALVLYLVGSELTKEEPVPPAANFKKPNFKKKGGKKKKPKRPKAAKAKKANTESPAKKAMEESKPPAVEKPKVADIPPETPTEPLKVDAPTPNPTPEPAPTEAPVIQEPPAVVADTATTPEPEVPTETPVEAPAEANNDDALLIKLGEEKQPEKPKAPSDEAKALENMTSKIEKKLEYVAPPNYERSGRGLVYNCVGKHWACVDKFSYLTCRENSNWSKENGKNPECQTKNVYASVEDCSVVQKHFIESSEPTEFCGGMAPSGNPDAGMESRPAEASADSEASEEIDLLE